MGEKKFGLLRRSAQRSLGTALFLLLAVATVGGAKAQEPLTSEDLKKQADALYFERVKKEEQAKQPKRSRTLSEPLGSVQPQIVTPPDLPSQLKYLATQMDAIRKAQGDLPAQLKNLEMEVNALRALGRGIPVQAERSSKIPLWVALFALALTGLLTTGTLLVGLLQLRRLRDLVEELQGLSKPVEERVEERIDPVLYRPPPPDTLPKSSPRVARSKKAQPPSPSQRRPPPRRRTGMAKPEGGDTGPSLVQSSPQRHQQIAELLARLHEVAPILAEGFSDSSTRERFRGEFYVPLNARLGRLRERAEDALEEDWMGRDLVPTLDGLARFYSEAVEEGRQGHAAANELAGRLRDWLYDRFSPACIGESWFSIDPIEPYVTEFDQHIHRAVDGRGRDIEAAAGKVLAIRAIGRRDPKSGAVIQKAEVIVGR